MFEAQATPGRPDGEMGDSDAQESSDEGLDEDDDAGNVHAGGTANSKSGTRSMLPLLATTPSTSSASMKHPPVSSPLITELDK